MILFISIRAEHSTLQLVDHEDEHEQLHRCCGEGALGSFLISICIFVDNFLGKRLDDSAFLSQKNSLEGSGNDAATILENLRGNTLKYGIYVCMYYIYTSRWLAHTINWTHTSRKSQCWEVCLCEQSAVACRIVASKTWAWTSRFQPWLRELHWALSMASWQPPDALGELLGASLGGVL